MLQIITGIINNRIIQTGAVAWTISQVLKTIIHLIINKKIVWERLIGDGGMPSSHSATVASVAMATGFVAGWDAPVFAVALFFAAVVMHDARGVRRETGKQAVVINNMIELAKSEGLAEGKSLRALSEINHIGLIDLLNHNADFMHKCIDKGYIAMGQMIDLNFLGVDLTKVPSWKPLEIIREPSVYLPLLMFPLLVVVINLVQMKLMQFLKPGYKEQKEAKQREKNNPARAGQTPEDQAEATTKMMNWMMPVIMLITTFSLPAAMGLYWVIGGIMGIVTNLITYFMFTKPYELKKQELAEKKANAFKKKKADDSSEDQNKGKKKRKK